jgi:enoyl-CoA hydratase
MEGLAVSDEVICRIDGAVGHISLNRPQALHALTTAMCAAMTQALMSWRTDPAVRVVLIDHAPGTRGFCAGGDIRMLAESGAGDGTAARAFFHTEYRLNHLLHVYPKPVVALMNGVTMGGGVGVSVHALFRIATDRTTFAMPETGIGLFPDVGGGWFLPRLPEAELGTWLALTGARLKGRECVGAGVATHYMPEDLLSNVRAQIAGAALTHEPANTLRSGLDALCEADGALFTPHPDGLKALFGFGSVEEIFTALAAAGESPWAREQLAALRTKSPQTLKVALRQLRMGAKAGSFAENMITEYRIATRVVARHDFREGVRAVIVDKDNKPVWDPADLAGVTEAMLDAIFAPLPADQEWTPLPGLS